MWRGAGHRSAKLLHFLPDDAGFVQLLRMEPGVKMPLHRHAGEVRAYNLAGSRVLCTGEIIGPGDYVYEPPGNTDWWQATEAEPLIVFVVVMGEVEFLGESGEVTKRVSAATLRKDWDAYCRAGATAAAQGDGRDAGAFSPRRKPASGRRAGTP